ncbi:T9SS type A sorting domain-containing protein [Paracrocinitomix mangrovi]|uniref:T9SS type A sorting domain-containing protein n=1 Tax=Paracrocinitomix mangrovi TaxID=2862509 RepID=UPI001C8E3DD2|nr:T9SS type A sorting domain-containing protein [Paracrocinitomix mangrovi]UKN02998.1 T9SS type A sorting domain-containing protein [Paracrocinitomix mangrovi]
MSRITLLTLCTFFLNLSFAQINVQWEARYENPANFIDQAVDLELDAAGNTYVTGTSFNGSNYDWVTVKYDANGVEQWVMSYGGSGLDEAEAMAMDSNGDIVVTGSRFIGGNDWDIAVVKYDGTTGAQLWAQVYTGSSNFDGGKDITTDSNNDVILTGTYSFSSTDIDWIVIKYNSAGVFQWDDTNGTPDNDEGKVIIADASNNYYVAGHSEFSSGSTYFDFLLMKYNSAGTQLGSVTQDAGFNGLDTPHAIDLDASGNIFVGGQGFNALDEEDYVLMKFNNSLAHQWTRTYAGNYTGLDRINALAVDQTSGNIFVTGRSKSNESSEDFYTIAYNTAGVVLWDDRYTSAGLNFDEATDIQIAASGFVYITGYTFNSGSNNDYTTVKYSSTGTLEWDTKFNGPSGLSDQAAKLRLDPAENIFVTGKSHGGVTNLDYSTIKYCQLTTVASADAAICNGQSVALSATGGINITWAVLSGDMGSLSCTNCSSTTASPNTTSVYTVSSESASGCIDYDTVTVTVNAIPSPTIYNDTPLDFCVGGSVILYTDSYAGYSWNTSATDSFIVANTAGTYTVTITDVNGCQNSTNAVVTTYGLPSVDAGTAVSVCPGSSTTLSASGATTYVWDTDITLSQLNISNPVATPTADPTWYYVTGTDGNGCQNNDSVQVSWFTLPVVNAGLDDQVCVGDSVQLGATGALTYVWNASTSLSSTTVANPYAFPTSITTYTVTGTDGNGCTDQDNVTISTLSLPNVNAGTTDSHCLGDSTHIFASGALTWQWVNDNDLSNLNTSNPWASNTIDKWFYVYGTDVNGCTNIDSVEITVDPLPNVTAGPDISICTGDSVQLNATGADTYVWDSHPTFLSPTNVSNPWVKPIVQTTYVFTGTNTTTGCENTTDITVSLNALPNIDAGLDTSMCIGDSLQLMATGGVTYIWSNASTLSSNIIADPWSFTTTDVTYYLDGYDANGCFGEDSIHVIVNPLPSAPAILEVGQWLISSYNSGNQWYLNGSPVAGATNDSLNWVDQAQNGSYTLLYTDANGCQSFSPSNNIIIIDDIGFEENNAIEVKMYPNPTNGLLNIELGEDIDMLFVTTLNGKVLMLEQNILSGIKQIDLSELPTGVYMIQIVKDDRVLNRRIVKQ